MESLLNYRVRRRSSERTDFEAKSWHQFINWGSSRTINTKTNLVINPPEVVQRAGNKLLTFQALQNKEGINIPEFTTDRGVASGWIGTGKSTVVCRTKLSGHSGDGIVLASTEDQIVDAPLYVKYVKKQREFRIHVSFGEVIDVQEKRKRRDLPEEFSTNFQVRNHHTGWVYCRENVELSEDATRMAVEACRQLGLDFGAVDIIYNARQNLYYVLEVNTAPGLEGTTVDKYAESFVKKLSL